MAPVKNPSLTIDVAHLLPNIDFLMAGGGELFNQIEAVAPANVRLLSWVDAAEVIPAADIFLSTSLNEGIPYSLLEVLSAGVPVVAIESGAIAEIIQNEVNGYLTSKDPTEIADQLQNLITDTAKRLRVGKCALNSRTLASELDKMASTHVSLYENII
jgi:glycosyltransferase involved in cell wall biosynthesis